MKMFNNNKLFLNTYFDSIKLIILGLERLHVIRKNMMKLVQTLKKSILHENLVHIEIRYLRFCHLIFTYGFLINYREGTPCGTFGLAITNHLQNK